MSFYQYVSGLKDQALPSVDNVIEYGMTTFPSIPLDAPKISNMTCRGYEGVPNMKLDFSQVVKNRKSFCDDDGAVFMATYQIGSLQAACQALKRVYARYGYNGDQTVDNQVNKDRETLISLYNAYEASPSFEIDFTSLPSLSLGTPTLTVTTNLYGPYGGGGGGPWDATVANPVLALNGGRRLKSLLIYSGRSLYVDRLTCQFSDGAEQSWGDMTDANPTAQISLDSDEFITEIVAWYGAYVDKLQFSTNKGRSIEAGGPAPVGSATISIPAGSVLLGFKGRAGAYIDQIGFQIAQFQPAIFR